MAKLRDIPLTFRIGIETNSKVEELSRAKGINKSKMIRGFISEGLQRLIQESEGLIPQPSTRFKSYRYHRINGKIVQHGVSGDGQEFKLSEFELNSIYDLIQQFPELLSLNEFTHIIDLINSSFDKIEEKKVKMQAKLKVRGRIK